MRNFLQIGQGLDMLPLQHALMMHPELWNQHRFRTTFARTPFSEVDDIYIRFSDAEKLEKMKCTEEFYSDLALVWYPAARVLPVQKLVADVMHRVGGYQLMRTLITRLRPGGRMLPHADTEGTYVSEGSIMRYHVVVKGEAGSLFRCGDETVNMRTGEVWAFNALLEHEVLNNSIEDRIHLLVDCRIWPS